MSHTDSFNQDLEKQESDRLNKPLTQTSFRHDSHNIYINDVPINKQDFVYAFGGNLEVGARKKTTELLEYANPVPAGLAAFSATTVSLGLVQMHARHVSHANVLLGALLTTSGVVELIVGILCFIVGNTWACCTFLMFGGFWSSYAFVLMDVGGIMASYSSTDEYNQGIALFFLPWALFSFFLWACTWKSTLALSLLMFLIWFFVFLFTIAQFIGSVKLYKAGGFFCLLSGCVGFYNMYAGISDKTNAYLVLKPVFLPNAYKPEEEKE